MQDAILELHDSVANLSQNLQVSQLILSAQKLTLFLDQLNLKILYPAKIDIIQNIQKANKSSSYSIQEILQQDGKESEGVLWLIITEKFIVEFLINLSVSENLSQSIQDSYDMILRERHNFIIRGMFLTGFKFVPQLEEMKEKTGLELNCLLKQQIQQMKQGIDILWEFIQ